MTKINLELFKSAETLKYGETGTAYCIGETTVEKDGKATKILNCIIVLSNGEQIEENIVYNDYKFNHFKNKDFVNKRFDVIYVKESYPDKTTGLPKDFIGWNPVK